MLFVYIWLCLVGIVWSYPTYVPQQACITMSPESPGHGNVPPQNYPAPYDFVLDREVISNSESVKFSIVKRKGGPTFKGFMIQARTNADSAPIGTFKALGGDSQAMDCSNNDDTVTHTNADEKTSVTVQWNPPADFNGSVNFYATTVEDLLTFWVKTSAATLTVQ